MMGRCDKEQQTSALLIPELSNTCAMDYCALSTNSMNTYPDITACVWSGSARLRRLSQQRTWENAQSPGGCVP